MKGRKEWRWIWELTPNERERIKYVVVYFSGYGGGKYEAITSLKFFIPCGSETLLGAKRQATKVHATYRNTFVAVYPAEKIPRYYGLGRTSLGFRDIIGVKPLYVRTACWEKKKCKN